MLVTASQAITFSTIASISLTLVSLNKPVDGFFGIFRRRSSPVQEVAQPEPQSFFQRPQGGFLNPFGGFGGGNMFFPGAFNVPSFGMFGQNRFPPQFKPPQQMNQGQRPQIPAQSGFPQPPSQPQRFPPQQFQPQQFPPQFPPQNFQPQQFPSQPEMDEDDFEPQGDEVPGMNNEEAESFFYTSFRNRRKQVHIQNGVRNGR